MRFDPPRCPNHHCPEHLAPKPGFFVRRGYYRPRCRDQPVPRFRCKRCGAGFSRQTFRHDYGDRRPECNAPVLELLTSGVSLRQTGRIVKLDIRAVQQKMRKIARTCWRLHDNLCHLLAPARCYQLDEEETYEHSSIRPVTMPVLIDRDTRFVVAVESGPIRRLAAPGTRRRQRQDREEACRGRRPDWSRACVTAALEALKRRLPEGPLVLHTDEKSTYATIARQLFGDRVLHETTPSKLHRGTHNPLFPINHTLAMTRDNMGRLRRQSWLVSKRHQQLRVHAGLFVIYRNYIRRRFNRDRKNNCPARLLRLLPRQLTFDEALAWRQDWGRRSVHPMSHTAQTDIATGVASEESDDSAW